MPLASVEGVALRDEVDGPVEPIAAPVDLVFVDGELGVPACFLVGADDELTTPWLLEATAAGMGGAELHVVDDAGHSVSFEESERFNASIASFVERRGR